ncbi:MAG: DUF427 domain-containing protein [Gammaproteobacteria bacterium]|nr:DUF427 domain-containing protein [Gammaproteobacteria bacterium]
MSNSAPGFEAHPGYEVKIEPSGAHVRALVGATVVADTTSALAVTESRHRSVWYLPLADVDQALLTRTDTSTYCPFKGHASYWSISAPEANLEDAVWGYESPFDECVPLTGYVAFYTDRVALEVDGQPLAAVAPGWTD